MFMMKICVVILLTVVGCCGGEWLKTDLVFCTLSEEEFRKCQDLATATMTDQLDDDRTFGSYFRRIQCTVPYPSPEECMKEMDLNDDRAPSVMVVDSGDVFIGGRYHSLVPILREVYEDGRDYYNAVAVIKKDSLPDVYTLHDLRGKHACFAGVGTQAGWTIPLYNMIQTESMPVVDCNNYVKSTSEFFGESCAANTLQDRYNPLGDNSNSLCEICGSSEPGVRCTIKDPYAGFHGAMKCLQDRGDIAFVKYSTVVNSGLSPDEFELLCLDGSRAALNDYASCSWGIAPGHFVIVSSAMELKERFAAQKFLAKVVKRYGRAAVLGANDTSTTFDINESVGEKYGSLPDLLFSDDVTELLDIEP